MKKLKHLISVATMTIFGATLSVGFVVSVIKIAKVAYFG